MNTSKLKSRLLIAILTAGVGFAVLLYGYKLSWVPRFDQACIKLPSNVEDLVYDFDTETHSISHRLLKQQPDRGRPFQMIHVTDDPDHIFENTPPSPLDYAIVLELLRKKGYSRVVLATRMTWDDEPGLEATSLNNQLTLFQHAIIGLPVTRGASTQPLPAPLQRAVIPLSQVQGNHQLIPIVNQVPLPAHAEGNEHTLAGFHQIESSPASSGHIALLAHWEGIGLIPSLELLSIMTAHDTTPSELIIQPGKYIRFGKDGPIMPLDDYGQTPTPPTNEITDDSSIPKAIKAEELILTKPEAPAPKHPQVCFIHATGTKTSPTNLLTANRVNELVTMTQNLPSPVPGTTTIYHRLPQWAEIIIIADITLIAFWLVGFSPFNRRLAVVLTATLLFSLLFTFMDLTQHWFSMSAPLASLVTVGLFPNIRREKNHPPKNEDNEETGETDDISNVIPSMPISRG